MKTLNMIALMLLIHGTAYADVRIDRIIQVESSGNPRAVSKADCRGLMQMSRIAWADVRKHYPEMKYDFDKYAFDPVVNVRMGTLYLEIIKNKYLKGGGSDKDILICYHDGLGNWKKWKRGERKLGREMLQNLARYGVKI
ncbi:MAG: transglycosylase SLT domain-containing protein [Smithella sp.]